MGRTITRICAIGICTLVSAQTGQDLQCLLCVVSFSLVTFAPSLVNLSLIYADKIVAERSNHRRKGSTAKFPSACMALLSHRIRQEICFCTADSSTLFRAYVSKTESTP